MEGSCQNLLQRQMVYLANELVKAGWDNMEAEPDGIKEGFENYRPLDLHLEEGTPSGVLIPSIVEAMYREHLKRPPGEGQTLTFCQKILPDLIKEFFPYLLTRTAAITRLQKICAELNLEYSDFKQATGLQSGGHTWDMVRDEETAGQSPAWQELLRQAARAAWSQAPILLTGESGTGKEVVARFIHEHSPRAKGPFVPLNCGAVPENLLESELFGYRKGAFSEARQDKQGLYRWLTTGPCSWMKFPRYLCRYKSNYCGSLRNTPSFLWVR